MLNMVYNVQGVFYSLDHVVGQTVVEVVKGAPPPQGTNCNRQLCSVHMDIAKRLSDVSSNRLCGGFNIKTFKRKHFFFALLQS